MASERARAIRDGDVKGLAEMNERRDWISNVLWPVHRDTWEEVVKKRDHAVRDIARKTAFEEVAKLVDSTGTPLDFFDRVKLVARIRELT